MAALAVDIGEVLADESTVNMMHHNQCVFEKKTKKKAMAVLSSQMQRFFP